MNAQKIEGAVVLVTGANRGIGTTLARNGGGAVVEQRSIA
jgi:hypothetical protein